VEVNLSKHRMPSPMTLALGHLGLSIVQ